MQSKPQLPKLRFPEFLEGSEWTFPHGDKLFDLVDRRPAQEGLPVLAITQEHGAVSRDEIDYHVSVTDASIASYKEVRPGDFIISLRSFQGGIEYSRVHGICSPAYVILGRKGDGADDFYRHLFKSPRFIQQITRNIEGLRDGKMISYKQFSEQLLPAPSPPEQRKIAGCLNSADDLIAAEGRKLEALRRLKKGVMQNLFPIEGETIPRVRYPEFRGAAEWEPISLQEASVPVTERVGKRKLTPVSISAGIGFVPQSEKFGRDISGNQYQVYTLVRDGDFVYNKGNSLKFPQGCIYLLRGWGQVAAPNVFICFRLKEGYSNSFFQNCFEQNQHGNQLKKHITSGARSNGLLNISKERFFAVEIPIPSPPEQQKIADCLDALDILISVQAKKLDALKNHKQGLIQILFPSLEATTS